MAKKTKSNPNLKNNSYGPDAVVLVSRKNHPVLISYGEEALVIPPRARIVIENKKMLGAYPKGISAVKL